MLPWDFCLLTTVEDLSYDPDTILVPTPEVVLQVRCSPTPHERMRKRAHAPTVGRRGEWGLCFTSFVRSSVGGPPMHTRTLTRTEDGARTYAHNTLSYGRRDETCPISTGGRDAARPDSTGGGNTLSPRRAPRLKHARARAAGLGLHPLLPAALPRGGQAPIPRPQQVPAVRSPVNLSSSVHFLFNLPLPQPPTVPSAAHSTLPGYPAAPEGFVRKFRACVPRHPCRLPELAHKAPAACRQ